MSQLELFENVKKNSKQTIIHGDCLDEMRKMKDNTIDFIVTDPPYGLHFMGKNWDGRVPAIEVWSEALRICKPGSMLSAFGGDRTHHHLMYALEVSGWEIRTCIYWIFGSGFPKSHNFGKQLNFEWNGYGTALKPAAEIIVLAMKPLDGTFVQNAEKWGVAGINIDENRIGSLDYSQDEWSRKGMSRSTMNTYGDHNGSDTQLPSGRWPANLILDEESAEDLDKMTGVSKSTPFKNPTCGCHDSLGRNKHKRTEIGKGHNDSGGASRFFYVAKASSSERNKGLEGMTLKESSGCYGQFEGDGRGRQTEHSPRQNTHPTVKPISLMKYIIKLLAPPGNPTCLDPFTGSGSTGVACKELDINFIGIEKEKEYVEIAQARIANS
jgi:site-specific DNA-methyltransferase (adenine-specific)